ncbi:T9SS type A sorting domain-containing protein [Saccharicrinis fermentans]|uniref:Uncharacterized protein n=1 Tax=Saccharicrinis fermentans DSM 9555 = JCM 21142 TaxID=869213 RepID=W7Y5V3_9BACT|nr:T9SS type A sorting domain-containing protein [Saccharicrinis fermentans]GAF02978.1 hypothetical protein JCM21142_41630 [Saccharicrinis fermentans DSM 9555 = JCM 21142]
MKQVVFVFLTFIVSGYLSAQEVMFTESGEYLVPDGVTRLWIEAVGAGGNGGSNGMSGGGGGGYALGVYDVTPGQTLSVSIGAESKVDDLLSATAGVNASYSRDDDGFGIVGEGGIGTGGNIANYKGGDGGKGYYTYYGGGGGGAAGPNGNGQNGGDTYAYGAQDCPPEGGAAGESGGYPGGAGGKGAGYDNCAHGYGNSNPSTAPENYGGGGGGGNGSGYVSTAGAGGFVRISTASLVNGVTAIGLTLHAHDTESTYQWIDADYNNIDGATSRSFQVKDLGSYAVKLTQDGTTRTSSFTTITFDDFVGNSASFGATVFEESGEFIHDNFMTDDVLIEVVGAGGNGGSNGMSGGGGGGYASGMYTLTPNESLTVEVAEASVSGSVSSVGGLLSATSGSNASYTRDDDGFGVVGVGGVGADGNIANYTGGDGGKGYFTYYGGGGGGAAGRMGNGQNGGDTYAYGAQDCPPEGGAAGESGGYPGGAGGKGAGYDNCSHGYDNTNPSTDPDSYGGGGGGGNGSGYASTAGADGFVSISYCDFYIQMTRSSNVLTFENSSGISYQWLKISSDNSIEYLTDETGPSFEMPESDDQYALYAANGTCSLLSDLYTPYLPTDTRILEEAQIKVEVYPNPVRDVLYINADQEILKIQLISTSGKVIKASDGVSELNVQDVPKGLYLIHVTFHSGNTVHKVVIK